MNSQTADEQQVQEISGIAYQFQPKFFDKMYEELGIKLENIVYYKDETHYFVMTATKSSLKERGVLKQVILLITLILLITRHLQFLTSPAKLRLTDQPI